MAGPARSAAGPLRILHVAEKLDAEDGGIAAAVPAMCAALAARGHKVALYATGLSETAGVPAGSGKIFDQHLFRRFGPLSASPGLARALRRAGDWDIIHIHTVYRFPQAAAAHYARAKGVPYCVQLHGSLAPELFHKPERRLRKRLYEWAVERRNLARAASLICTSEGERAAIAMPGLRTPCIVIPLGLHLTDYAADADPGGFRRHYGLGDHPIVLWMGRLVPIKALDVLIEAFAQVARAHPGARLVLAGPDPGDEGTRLRDLVAAKGLTARVLFTGMLDHQDKLSALRAARLFVLPSRTENFGLAALEAMAVGCPVIVSEGVKIAPDITDTGVVVPVGAPAPLAAAINAMLDDDAQCARMSAAAQNVAARYDWSVVSGLLEEAYRRMLGYL